MSADCVPGWAAPCALSYEGTSVILCCGTGNFIAYNPCGAAELRSLFHQWDEQRYVDLAAFAPLTDTSWAALLWTSAERSVLLYGDSERGEIREVAVPAAVSIAPADGLHLCLLSTGELRQVNLATGERRDHLAQLGNQHAAWLPRRTACCLYLADSLQGLSVHRKAPGYKLRPLTSFSQAAWFPACVAGDRYVLGDYVTCL